MGEVYSRRVLGAERPRVALLSNGEEDSKGNELTRASAAALRRARGFNFCGYCEGRDLLTGEFDVIVADGFTGNVALKTMEGTAKVMVELLKRAFKSTPASAVGGLLAKRALGPMKRSIDWREIGGAPLVGVAGVGCVTHGSSDALAVLNAVLCVRATADANVTEEIARAAARSAELFASAGEAEGPSHGAQTGPGVTARVLKEVEECARSS